MLGFDIEFLRPWWFLILIPAAYLLWRLWQQSAKEGAWHQVIAPEFQSLLLGSQKAVDNQLNKRLGLYGLALLWFAFSFVLAGPTLKSVEIPAQKNQQGVVIVLDMSLSMLADDLSPTRLNQARFKIEDLLKRHPELSIGMVTYAASAHTVSPISQDNQTLLGLMPALNPLIMPAYGSDPLTGLDAAKALFEGAHVTQGHIIWIADDIESEQMATIRDWFAQNDYSLSILTAGSAQGGMVEIPNYGLMKAKDGSIIIPRVPEQRFAELSQSLNANLIPLRLDNENLDPLLPPALQANSNDEDEKAVMHPLDEGAALLLLLVPLSVFLFRRGWIFSWMLALIIPFGLVSTPQNAYANEESSRWEDLKNMFQSHDQQGYKAWNKDNFAAAEALFENNQWRASSLYRLERYEEAARLFEQDKSAQGQFNLGNAQAHLGNLEAAKQAYQQALKQRPEWVEAQQNLALVEKWLSEQAQSPQPQEGEQGGSGQASNSATDRQNQAQEQNDGGQNQEQQQADNAEQNAGEQTGDQNQNSESQDNQNAENSQQDTSESENKGENSDSQSAMNESEQNSENGENSQNDANSSNQSENSTQNSQTGEPSQSSSQSAEQQTTANNANAQSGEDSADSQNIAASEALEEVMSGQEQEHPDEAQTGASEETPEDGQTPSRLGQDTGEGSGADSNRMTEAQQAQQNWLGQIPDDPGIFLQRKFQYQYEQAPRRKQMEKSW